MNIKFEKSNIAEGFGEAHRTESETANNTNYIYISYRLVVQDKNGFTKWYDGRDFDAAKIKKNIDKMFERAKQGHREGAVIIYRNDRPVAEIEVKHNWTLRRDLVVFTVSTDFNNSLADKDKYYIADRFDVTEGILWTIYNIIAGTGPNIQQWYDKIKALDKVYRELMAEVQDYEVVSTNPIQIKKADGEVIEPTIATGSHEGEFNFEYGEYGSVRNIKVDTKKSPVYEVLVDEYNGEREIEVSHKLYLDAELAKSDYQRAVDYYTEMSEKYKGIYYPKESVSGNDRHLEVTVVLPDFQKILYKNIYFNIYC